MLCSPSDPQLYTEPSQPCSDIAFHVRKPKVNLSFPVWLRASYLLSLDLSFPNCKIMRLLIQVTCRERDS